MSLAETYGPMIENDRARAVAELEALVAREPDSVAALEMLTMAYQRRLDFERCAEAARALLAIKPDHLEGLHRLGLSLIHLGDPQGALDVYQRAARIAPADPAAHVAAVLMHRLGRLDEAEQALRRSLSALEPSALDMWPVQRSLMAVLRDAGRPLEADHFAHALAQAFARTPSAVSSYLVFREQAVTFSDWVRMADKSRLADVLKRGAAAEPEGARFPESFELPRDRAELARFAAAAPKGTLYIVKPVQGSGGQGIRVVGDAGEVAGLADVVVQRYLDRPRLIDGRKGHLRIYALITSAEPLRAYVYEEGIVRFAPEPYDPRPERLSDISMHVTNTALHTGHPGLVICDDASVEDRGAIWSLSAVLRRLEAEGRPRAAVFGEICELVAWFLRQAVREGLFERQAQSGPRRAFGPKLLGFDVLLDEDARPWLIEIQTNPAMRGAPLVSRINAELFGNIFRMTVAPLVRDGMAPELVAEVLRAPEALVGREIALELENRGRFRPLAV
jgi:Tfp pilus assembly protein PilF